MQEEKYLYKTNTNISTVFSAHIFSREIISVFQPHFNNSGADSFLNQSPTTKLSNMQLTNSDIGVTGRPLMFNQSYISGT